MPPAVPKTVFTKLSKAPIVEAVIELKVRMAGQVDPARFLDFRDQLVEHFPVSRDMQYVQSLLHFDAEKGPQQVLETGKAGIRLESADQRWVVQARVDGVSISRLAPYERWEALRQQAEAVWPVYIRALNPTTVIRLGVRYINRVELADEVIDFDRVLTVGPKIPPALPQKLTEFFSRIVIPMEEKRATLVLVQAFDPPPPAQGGALPAVVLDIDAFSEQSHEIESREIWDALERLRGLKNMAFFNCITADTLETLK